MSEITGKGQTYKVGGVVKPGDKFKYSDGDKIPLSVTGTVTAIRLCVDGKSYVVDVDWRHGEVVTYKPKGFCVSDSYEVYEH